MRRFFGLLRNVALLIVAVSVAGRLCSYVAELLIAFLFGATYETDAFIVARSFPTRISAIAGWAIFFAVTPELVRARAQSDAQATALLKRCLRMTVAVFVTVAIVIALASRGIVFLLAPGFDASTRDVAGLFLSIMAWSMLTGCATSLLQAVNASKRRGLLASSAQAVHSAVFLASLILCARYKSLLPAAIGVVAATCVKLGAQLADADTARRVWTRSSGPVEAGTVRRISRIALYVAAALVAQEPAVFVIRAIASRTEGCVTMFNYGYLMVQVPLLLFSALLVFLLYPMLIDRSLGCDREFSASTVEIISTIVFVLVPASVLCVIVAGPAVKVLLVHGNFDQQAAQGTVRVLKLLAPSLLGLALSAFALQVSVIRDRLGGYLAISVLRLALIGLLAVGLNTVFGPIMSLALGYSIGSLVSGAFFLGHMRNLLDLHFDRRSMLSIGKTCINTLIALGAAVLSRQLLSGALPVRGTVASAVELVVCALVFGGVFLVLARLSDPVRLRFLTSICSGHLPLSAAGGDTGTVNDNSAEHS